MGVVALASHPRREVVTSQGVDRRQVVAVERLDLVQPRSIQDLIDDDVVDAQAHPAQQRCRDQIPRHRTRPPSPASGVEQKRAQRKRAQRSVFPQGSGEQKEKDQGQHPQQR